ncbi:hypothetical protein [Vagococcus sp. WN89Y]|uniref:hypothetical protein n=1 Tax=Vagococcus sp. WN89Y TaxID=3457258 RepID=UPI003FCD0A5E
MNKNDAELFPRFFARNGYAWITVGQQAFLLSTMPDGAPFIIDADGSCRFVRFNQKKSAWEFVSEVDNHGYTPENLKLLEEYSLSKVDPVAIKAMEYNEELNVLEAKSTDAKHHRGVFARGKFIPTAWFDTHKKTGKPALAAKTVVPAACNEPASAKLIAKSDYGWQVEPASVKMDEYLKILLEDKDRCVKKTPVRPLELIDPANGLSDDNAGKKFLKKDYRYFNVERNAANSNAERELTLTDFKNATIAWKNGVMLLKHADNIIHALKNDKIKNTVVNSEPFYIESDTVNYLRENAASLTDTPDHALYWRYSGLWQGKNGAMLIVADNKYAVREYSDAAIYVKHAKYPAQSERDIVLWSTGDTLVRVRDGSVSTPYTDLHYNDALLPLSIETSLHSLLLKSIQSDLISNIHPAAEDLLKIEEFTLPVAWLDKRNWQSLFLYRGEYFPAMFIDARSLNNPCGMNSIRVYEAGDFYRAKKELATFVIQRDADKIEMKTWESLIAETLNVKHEAAALYLKNFPWRHTAKIRSVEEAVSEVLATGKHYVAPAGEPFKKTWKNTDIAAQRRFAREHLYPARIKPNQLKLLKLTAEDKTINARKKEQQTAVKDITQFIKNDVLTTLQTSLTYNSPHRPVIKSYLHNAFGVDSDEFQSALAATWRKNLQKVNDQLSADNIYLVHGKDIKLKDTEKNAGNRVFMSPESGHIYINTHKLNHENNEQVQLSAEIIQAVAYQQGINCDFLDIAPIKSMATPVCDAGDIVTDRLKQRKLTQPQWLTLKETSKKYLQQVPAYKHKTNSLMVPEKLAYLSHFDPAYRSHLYLNSAPLLTLLSLDTFYQLASKNKVTTKADAWIKQYCALRASCPSSTITPPPTSPSTSTSTTAKPWPHLPALHWSPKKDSDESVDTDASEAQESVEDSDEASRRDTDTSLEESVEDTDEDSDDTSLQISEEESDDSSWRDVDESSEDVSEDTEDTSIEDTDDTDSHPGEELGDDADSPSPPRGPTPDSPGLPAPPVPVPPVPVPPVPAPPLPGGSPLHPIRDILAPAAGGGALAGAGVGIGLGAPKLPSNTTENHSTERPETHSHKKSDQFFRHPQINIKNTHGHYIPDPNDNVFLPEQTDNPPESGTVVEKDKPQGWRHPIAIRFQGRKLGENEDMIYVEGHGNVVRVEIPELACLGEKKLTVSHMLRLIGQALVAPAVTNALAWQEIYELEIKGGDCPTPEDVYWLADRVEVFDAIINTVLGLVPIFWPAFALKNLLGPTLILIADALDGKSISIGDVLSLVLNAILQVFSFFRTEIPMLNGAQRVKFISKPDTLNPGKTSFPFANRFSFKSDGNPYIKIKEREYMLETTDEATTVVQDENGHYQQVKFNQQENRWDMFYSAKKNMDKESRVVQTKYRYPLNDLPRNAVAEAGAKDSIIIKIPGKPTLTGVFIDMDFIPARLESIDGQTIAYTTLESVPDEEQRLLVWSPYGWDFERPSVRMDRNLKILLANKDDASMDVTQARFGAMRESNGLSYDYWGNAYLKKDNVYYKVNKQSGTQTDNVFTLPDYSDAQIKFNKGYFSLEHGDDMLFTLKTLSVKDKNTPFRIESAALDYLRKYAVKLTSTEAKSSSSLFTVDDENFVVTSRTDKDIQFTSKPRYGSTPIKLWSDNGVWFRIRETTRERSLIEYISQKQCRVTRTPGGGSSCVAQGLSIDTDLNIRLHRAIREEMTSNTLPALSKLTPVRTGEIPGLYQDKKTNQHYLNYAGNYFNAKILSKTNKEENPTGYPCVKVTGRSDFFNREKEIATVVVIKDGDTINFVDIVNYLAEKVNITPEQARMFIKNRPFINMENANEIESLMNQVQLSEDIYVERPLEITTTPQTRPSDSALLEMAKKALIPDNILKNNDFVVEIHDLHTTRGTYNPTLQQARIHISGQMDYLQNTMLVSVLKSLNPLDYNNPLIEDYLSEIFESDDTKFLSEVQNSLYSRLLSAKDELARRNIKLITAIQTNPSKSAKYVNKITSPVYIGEGNDDMLFINIDDLGLDETTKSVSTRELTGAVLDAVMLSSKRTFDLLNVPLKDGAHINIKDAYAQIQKSLVAGKFSTQQKTKLHSVISKYLSKTPVYQSNVNILNDMPENSLKFNYMFRNDVGFRAHVTLNSHHFVTLMTQDLHYRVATYQQDVFVLHPWVKNHGVKRGVNTFFSGTENYTDELTPRELEISFLNRLRFDAKDVTAVPGSKNVFSTADNNLYLKWQNNYYPIQFLGKSQRIVEVGAPNEVRQIYYYHPISGNISIIPHSSSYGCMMKYYPELELYERSSVEAGYSEVFRFDPHDERLVSTGATKIVHMPGNVVRIEFPQFSLYHTKSATSDLYLQGHGKTSRVPSIVPNNIEVKYYTAPGHQLVPYKGSAVDFISGRFTAKEIKNPGETTEKYTISEFTGAAPNPYHLARKYNKNMLHMLSPSMDSETLMTSISNLFGDKQARLNLYMCRKFERGTTPQNQPSTSTAVSAAGEGVHYNSGLAIGRWAFDQEFTTTTQPGSKGFAPLKEGQVYLRPHTVDALVTHSLQSVFKEIPYETWYGFETNEFAKLQVPPYIIESRAQLRNAMIRVKNTLSNTLAKLDNAAMQEKIDDYISVAFDTVNTDIINQVKERLKVISSRIKGYIEESQEIDYKNIAISSTIRAEDPKIPRYYPTKLKNEPSSIMAFVLSGDGLRRMFVIDDFFPKVKSSSPQQAAVERTQEHYIIHESSHTAADTVDVFYTLDMNFREQDVQLGVRRLDSLLSTGNIKKTSSWRNTIPAIFKHLNMQQPDDAAAIKFINDNPMVRANIIIENADSVTRYILDIAKLGQVTTVRRDVADEQNDLDYKLLALSYYGSAERHL